MKGEARTQHNTVSRERWQGTRKDASLAFGLGSPQTFPGFGNHGRGLSLRQSGGPQQEPSKTICRLGVGKRLGPSP